MVTSHSILILSVYSFRASILIFNLPKIITNLVISSLFNTDICLISTLGDRGIIYSFNPIYGVNGILHFSKWFCGSLFLFFMFSYPQIYSKNFVTEDIKSSFVNSWGVFKIWIKSEGSYCFIEFVIT
jgi:hypothetical protein